MLMEFVAERAMENRDPIADAAAMRAPRSPVSTEILFGHQELFKLFQNMPGCMFGMLNRILGLGFAQPAFSQTWGNLDVSPVHIPWIQVTIDPLSVQAAWGNEESRCVLKGITSWWAWFNHVSGVCSSEDLKARNLVGSQYINKTELN